MYLQKQTCWNTVQGYVSVSFSCYCPDWRSEGVASDHSSGSLPRAQKKAASSIKNLQFKGEVQ